MKNKAKDAQILKSVISAALTLGLICNSLRLQGAEEKADHILDKSSATLAATLALNKLSNTIAQAPADDNSLYTEMMAAPASYTDPTKAEELLKTIFAKGISDSFASDATQMLIRLADGKDATELFGADFIIGATNAPQELVDTFVAKHYKTTFQKARKRACKEQATRIAAKVSPTEEEIDNLPKDELSKLMATRVAQAQSEPVFQENMKYIGDAIVKPMLEDAYNQRDFQRAFSRTCAVNGIAQSTIATNILLRLTANIKAKKDAAKTGEVIYGIFPSVIAVTIPECAENRAKEILSQALADTKLPLDINALAKEISVNPKSHRTIEDSRKAFQQGLSTKLIAAATEKTLSLAQPNEKGETQAFAKNYFSSAEITKGLNTRITKELDTTLKPLRNAFAEIQFKESFPTLEAKEWYPDENLIDHVAESNDFRRVLKKWRKLDALEEFAKTEAQNPLLEETSQKLDKTIVESFEPGTAALISQHKSVKDLFAEIKGGIAKEGATPKLNKIVDLYTKRVSDKWEEEREKLLPKELIEKKLYKDLFPSTKRLIELMAKTIMESMAEPTPEEEKPKPPEDTPQPPPEELKEIEMKCRLIFTRAHEEIEIEVLIDDKRTARHTCPYAPTSYRKNVASFTDKVARSVSDIVEEATKKNRVALTIILDVQDPLIYYSAVSDISWILKQTIELLGEYITKYEVSENR